MRNLAILVPLLMILATPGIAAGEIPPDAFIEGDYLVIVRQGEAKRFYLPTELKGNKDFTLQIDETNHPDAEQAKGSDSKKREPAKNTQPNHGLMIARAKALYKAGKVNQALELLNLGEVSFPDSAQMKSMKGSLLYYLGRLDEAKTAWKESLALNPQQPELNRFIEKAENPTPPPVAR